MRAGYPISSEPKWFLALGLERHRPLTSWFGSDVSRGGLKGGSWA